MSDDLRNLPVEHDSRDSQEDLELLRRVFDDRPVFKDQTQIKTFINDIKDSLLGAVLFGFLLWFNDGITSGISRAGAKTEYVQMGIKIMIFAVAFYILQHKITCEE